MKIECNKCKTDTKTRIVVKRTPLEEVDTILPEGYKELYCSNIIKFKRKGRDVNEWITDKCRNRIIIKKLIKNDKEN